MQKIFKQYGTQLVTASLPLIRAIDALDRNPEYKILLGKVSQSLTYGILLKRSLRQLSVIGPKLASGERLTRKEAAALATLVYYVPYFAVSSAVIAQKEGRDFLAALDRLKSRSLPPPTGKPVAAVDLAGKSVDEIFETLFGGALNNIKP